MNQTQRNFAFQKAFEIFVGKLKVLAEEDVKRIRERELFVYGSEHVQAAIVSGKLKPYPKTAKRKFDGIAKDLSAYFPVLEFYKKRNALADKAGMLKTYDNGPYEVKLRGPKNTYHSWYRHHQSAEFFARVDAAQKALTQFETDLMLGTSAEAKQLLANLENITF